MATRIDVQEIVIHALDGLYAPRVPRVKGNGMPNDAYGRYCEIFFDQLTQIPATDLRSGMELLLADWKISKWPTPKQIADYCTSTGGHRQSHRPAPGQPDQGDIGPPMTKAQRHFMADRVKRLLTVMKTARSGADIEAQRAWIYGPDAPPQSAEVEF